MIRSLGKFVAIILCAIFAVGIVTSRSIPRAAQATMEQPDTAKTYKSKCAMCHKAKAEKLYNADLPEEEQIQAILKGKKGAKPPAMPGFETKGINADQAKVLVAYMKSLKAAAPAKQ